MSGTEGATPEGVLEALEHMDAEELAEHDAAVSAVVAPDREIAVGTGETLLAIEGLTVRFGGLTALEDVSFDAEDRQGETLTVDAAYVDKQLAEVARNTDLSKYVL